MGVRMDLESKGDLKWTLWSALISFAAFAGVTATQAVAEAVSYTHLTLPTIYSV